MKEKQDLSGLQTAYMPAEYMPHAGTIMIWPERPGSWLDCGAAAEPVFAEVIREICRGETVYLSVSKKKEPRVRELLEDEIEAGTLKVNNLKTNDSWARDISPIFVVNSKDRYALDFQFNAWGGKYNGLYKHFGKDNKFASAFSKAYDFRCVNFQEVVLEGGSVHSNGAGTIMTTEECLLSPGRNPEYSKELLDFSLRLYFGAEKVVWLPYGVEGDETDGHVDNICAFVSKDTAVLGWTDTEGEQKRRSEANLKALEEAGLNVIKLPFPERKVCFTPEDIKRLKFERGEDTRDPGEKLAASYVNFYVCNACVLVPQFNDVNDATAVRILAECFPDRKIVPFDSTQFILGGGNVHCLTMQIPMRSVSFAESKGTSISDLLMEERLEGLPE
ncbi:MAG: agmatine deiminase family protein [Clostridia bacterium]|nr:agmatine deiminase family protein [Clostridia bacterium]